LKKYLALTIVMLVCLTFLVGCSGKQAPKEEPVSVDWEPTQFEEVNNTEDITMAIEEGTVSPTGLVVTLTNNSDKQYLYSEYMWLEKKINQEWRQLPPVIENFGFKDIAYILEGGFTKKIEINWEWLYGEIDAGHYRLIKDTFEADAEEYQPIYLAVEFEIE